MLAVSKITALRTAARSSIEISVCGVEWGRSMWGTSQKRIEEARTIERNIQQGTARLCSASPFTRACKGMWPVKTAEELAALVGCSVRSAAYYISGEQEPSARVIQAIFNLWLPPK